MKRTFVLLIGLCTLMAAAQTQYSNPIIDTSLPDPTVIRYAYRGFPMGNLYNEEGFPAAQFDVELK